MVRILREDPLDLPQSLSALSNVVPPADQLARCDLFANGVGSPSVTNRGVRPIEFFDDEPSLVKITFANEDGTTIYSEDWYEIGTEADQITVPAPTKPSDNKYDYVFDS